MLTEKVRSQILGGCMRDFKTYLAGYCGGFFTIIHFQNGRYELKISAWSQEDPDGTQLGGFLAQQKAQNSRILDFKLFPKYFTLTMKVPSLAKNIPDAVNSTAGPILGYLQNFHYSSGCESCGTTENIGCYEINGTAFHLCDSCLSQVHTSLQQNQQEVSSKKSGLVSGLVGAFLGSLIGCVLWVLIYRLGYIAGIAGAVTGICAMKGYEKLGGTLDKKGVIGSIIIMVLMIFFANRIAWAWEAYDALQMYGYTFADCFRGLGEILSLSELTGQYYGDLTIGYVLTLVCSFQSIRSAFQGSTGSFKINRRL